MGEKVFVRQFAIAEFSHSGDRDIIFIIFFPEQAGNGWHYLAKVGKRLAKSPGNACPGQVALE